MKKLILTIAFIVLFAGACHYEHNYTREDCKITYKNDATIEFIDKQGFVWYWEAQTQEEIELYQSLSTGDLINLKMHDNFTSANIDDDIIKRIEVR